MQGADARTIDVFWHPAVLDHDTGAGLFEGGPSELLDVPELHPENAERVRNMVSVLRRGPIAARLRWHDGRLATEDEVAAVHDPAYVAEIRDACAAGGRTFAPSTRVLPGSWQPIMAAAGTAMAAGDAVLDGTARVAYALVRPPGHHAGPATADGYCFFNNAALVAERARRAGCERVAVVDWDVHHGNGTQACFYERGDVLTVSMHMRHGTWGVNHPETGSPAEIGVGDGAGRNVNVEFALGAGDGAYTAALESVVVPILRQFRPDLIVGACGQDASGFDPNGRQNVLMSGFRRIGRIVTAAADELCGGRLVLVQEGGYARTYASYCLHATLEGVLGDAPELRDPIGYVPDDAVHGPVELGLLRTYLSRFWELPWAHPAP
jgi:acetoin utilization deacetylase AcuC-like enzyme